MRVSEVLVVVAGLGCLVRLATENRSLFVISASNAGLVTAAAAGLPSGAADALVPPTTTVRKHAAAQRHAMRLIVKPP